MIEANKIGEVCSVYEEIDAMDLFQPARQDAGDVRNTYLNSTIDGRPYLIPEVIQCRIGSQQGCCHADCRSAGS